jgi:uncharacterized protein YcbK (DUF882 family)
VTVERRATSLAAIAVGLLSVPAAASADPGVDATSSAGAAEPPKKLRVLQDKRKAEAAAEATSRARWQKSLDARIGAAPAPVVNIYNNWTHETIAVSAEKETPIVVAEPTIDQFFRCHFSNAPIDMDPRLFRTLVRAARHFGSKRIDIISAFRSPKFNLILRKKGREVARKSQHTLGHAVDFRVRGVSTKRLHAWAQKQKIGGVGYCPFSGFIHMDTGPVRYWRGR